MFLCPSWAGETEQQNFQNLAIKGSRCPENVKFWIIVGRFAWEQLLIPLQVCGWSVISFSDFSGLVPSPLSCTLIPQQKASTSPRDKAVAASSGSSGARRSNWNGRAVSWSVLTPCWKLFLWLVFLFFLVLPVYCYQPISFHPLHACVLSHVTLWTAARQAPLSIDFSGQEYWNGLPFSSPFDLLFFAFVIIIIRNSLPQRTLPLNLTVNWSAFVQLVERESDPVHL